MHGMHGLQIRASHGKLPRDAGATMARPINEILRSMRQNQVQLTLRHDQDILNLRSQCKISYEQLTEVRKQLESEKTKRETLKIQNKELVYENKRLRKQVEGLEQKIECLTSCVEVFNSDDKDELSSHSLRLERLGNRALPQHSPKYNDK